jgi:hypothetical protein
MVKTQAINSGDGPWLWMDNFLDYLLIGPLGWMLCPCREAMAGGSRDRKAPIPWDHAGVSGVQESA